MTSKAPQPYKKAQDGAGEDVQQMGIAVAVSSDSGDGTVTARRAGGITDLELCISHQKIPKRQALQHLAKAINIALKTDFIETELDKVYRAARVYRGSVRVSHMDYIGLGDGLFAKIGKTVKSFQLTFRGPDAGSPMGKEWIEQNGGGAISGVFNLIARKLNFLQEFEDMVPVYCEQMFDRLEAAKIITDWHRDEWTIETTFVGLDIVITPTADEESTENE